MNKGTKGKDKGTGTGAVTTSYHRDGRVTTKMHGTPYHAVLHAVQLASNANRAGTPAYRRVEVHATAPNPRVGTLLIVRTMPRREYRARLAALAVARARATRPAVEPRPVLPRESVTQAERIAHARRSRESGDGWSWDVFERLVALRELHS